MRQGIDLLSIDCQYNDSAGDVIYWIYRLSMHAGSAQIPCPIHIFSFSKHFSWILYKLEHCLSSCPMTQQHSRNFLQINQPTKVFGEIPDVYSFDIISNSLSTMFQSSLSLDIFTAWKMSVFVVFLVRIFPYLDWIRRDTDYLSIFSPNAWKYGPEKLRIRTLFTRCC